MSYESERDRIIQSNDVAGIVISAARETDPDLFVTLGLRYGIADALWVAGYRKRPPRPYESDFGADAQTAAERRVLHEKWEREHPGEDPNASRLPR